MCPYLPPELWDHTAGFSGEPPLTISKDLRDHSCYYPDILQQFAEFPRDSVVYRLYTKINRTPLSDKEKVQKIICRVQALFRCSQGLLPADLRGPVTVKMFQNAQSPDSRINRMNRAISLRRAENLIAFFTYVSTKVPIARAFLGSIQDQTPIAQARAIHTWMAEHEDELREFREFGFHQFNDIARRQPFYALPGIPPEIIHIQSMSPAVFPAILAHACKTSQFDFVDTMVSAYLQEDEHEAKNLVKGLVAGLIMEGEEETASHFMEYCKVKQIPVRMDEVYEFIWENVQIMDDSPEELARLVQSDAFQQIPLEDVYTMVREAKDRGSFALLEAIIKHHPGFLNLSFPFLLEMINEAGDRIPPLITALRERYHDDGSLILQTIIEIAARNGYEEVLTTCIIFEKEMKQALLACLDDPSAIERLIAHRNFSFLSTDERRAIHRTAIQQGHTQSAELLKRTIPVCSETMTTAVQGTAYCAVVGFLAYCGARLANYYGV